MKRFAILLAFGLAMTAALAGTAPAALVQAIDLTTTGPVQAGFTEFQGSVTSPAPTAAGTGAANGVTWTLYSQGGNTGWRDRGAIASVAASNLLRDLFFGANGLRVSFSGLTAGLNYSINLYGFDLTGNDGKAPWAYSTTGVTSGTGAGSIPIGYLHELPSMPAGFIPTPQTGTTTDTAGKAMLTQAFTAPADGTAHFFSTGGLVKVAGENKGSAIVLNGWELFTLDVPKAAIGLGGGTGATIITGGSASLGVTVTNTAAAGSADLKYTLSAAAQSGSPSLGSVAPGSGTLAPSASAAALVPASSTTAGQNIVRFTASDADASNSPQTLDVTLTVLDHSLASLGSTFTPSLSYDFGLQPQGAAASHTFNLWNLVQTAGLTAGLELDSHSGLSGTKFVSDLSTFSALAAGSSQPFTISFDTGAEGAFGATYTLRLSDVDLPGAHATGSQVLTISLNGQVVPEPASLTLLGLAGAGLARYARRRRRR